MTLGLKDIGIKKSEFVANTQFLFRVDICSNSSIFLNQVSSQDFPKT